VKARIKRNLLGGIVAVAPLAVTFFVILWVYRRISALPSAEILRLTDSAAVNDLIQVAFSIVAIILLLLLIGFVTRTAMGVILKDEMDRAAERIPIVRVIYKATKTGIETIVAGTGDFRSPVKIDFDGLRFTAFKTGGKTEGGREVIFLPTAPNITSGFVIEIDPDRMEEADESVEEALTRILSAGFGAGDKDFENLVEEAVEDMERRHGEMEDEEMEKRE